MNIINIHDVYGHLRFVTLVSYFAPCACDWPPCVVEVHEYL